MSGSSSAVERQLPKLDVAGSIPVSRSSNFNILANQLIASFVRPHEFPYNPVRVGELVRLSSNSTALLGTLFADVRVVSNHRDRQVSNHRLHDGQWNALLCHHRNERVSKVMKSQLG